MNESEWSHRGVRVNAVAPGIIESSGLNRYPLAVQAAVRASGGHNYCSRLGTEAECAAAIIFLASPMSSFITGDTIRVDGGQPLFHGMLRPADHSLSIPWTDKPSPKL